MSQIQTMVLELIRGKTGVCPQSDDTFDSLKIDSLAMAELTVEIEKAFAIRVDEDIMDVVSIEDLVAYIESKSACPRAH
jgi:acyl carrier protein